MKRSLECEFYTEKDSEFIDLLTNTRMAPRGIMNILIKQKRRWEKAFIKADNKRKPYRRSSILKTGSKTYKVYTAIRKGRKTKETFLEKTLRMNPF